MKQVLVTGATGFVGSHLAERLAAEGDRVRVLVRSEPAPSLLEQQGVQPISGDLRDSESLRRAVAGCEVVYHVAALTTRQHPSSRDAEAVNVDGTRHLLEACRSAGVGRVVHVSTAGVYGTLKAVEVDEETPPAPNTVYRATKLRAEQACREQERRGGTPVTIARLGSVYGPRSRNWLGLVGALCGPSFRMVGEGENHLDLVHVSDVAEGLVRCGRTPGAGGRTYLIASGERVRLRDFLSLLNREMGGACRLGQVPELPFRAYHRLCNTVFRATGVELPLAHRYEIFLANRRLSIARAREELGYQPRVSLEEGLPSLIAWYRAQGWV